MAVTQTNVLTRWRRALEIHLRANLQDGKWTVHGGERDEPSADRKLACVFAPPVESDGGNINFARPVMIIRAWMPRSPKEQRKPAPPDPEPLEQLMIDLMICLQPVQQSLLPDDLYFWVTRVTPDEDDWGVEAVLQGWMLNPATIAGVGA